MPYGIKNETPEQTKWMENCVGSITGVNKRTGKPYKEDEKIAICKWNLKKHGWKVPAKSEAFSEVSLREQLYQLESDIIESLKKGDVVALVTGAWVVDIYDTGVIISNGEKMFRVDYSMDKDGNVTIDWKSATEVERQTDYIPVKEEATKKVIPINSGRRITMGGRTIN